MDIQINSAQQGNVAAASTQAKPDLPVTEQHASAPVVEVAKAVSPVSSAEMQDQVKNAVEKVNQVVKNMSHGSSVEFTVDKETHSNVVRVIDTVTKELIRQFPSEEVLNIAKVLDRLQGLLIKDTA